MIAFIEIIKIVIFVLIMVLAVLFIFFLFITIPLMVYQVWRISFISRRYKEIHNKMLIFHLFKPSFFSKDLYKFYRAQFIWMEVLLLGGFSKKYFNKSFNKLCDFELIKKTKNKDFISLMGKHKNLHSFYSFVIGLFLRGFFIILVLLIILFIISIINVKIFK